MRVLIVDDEELARRGLEIRLLKMTDVEICGHSRNGREALEAVPRLRPDVIFLDIQMPGMDGFDVLRALAGPQMPIIIFATAFDRFAIQAFEANALDYLLKPIDEQRLDAAMQRARRQLAEREASEHRSRLLSLVCRLSGEELTLEQALDNAARDEASYIRRLAIRDGGSTVLLDVEDIDWIEAAGDYMCIHGAGRTHVMRATLKRLEALLDPGLFVRVHRSTIVNCRRVSSMRPHINGEYFLRVGDDKEVKLSRNYRCNLPRFAERLS